jgi:hypothetical protein
MKSNPQTTTETASQAPDLQELVVRVGGYNKITPEARKQFDADMVAYQVWIRRKKIAAPATRFLLWRQQHKETKVIANPEGHPSITDDNAREQRPARNPDIAQVMLGMTVRCVAPCGHRCKPGRPIWCSCGIVKLDFYSTRSKKWIWRCLWCRNRRGVPTEIEIERVKEFCTRYGFIMQPLTLHEDGKVYVY